MSIPRIYMIMLKDLRLGPRSPIFLYALIYPIVITLVVQVVFGSLFEPKPRLGVVDLGRSEITAMLSRLEGVELTRLDTVKRLKQQVEQNDLDAGLVLKEEFDTAMRSGRKPLLEFYVGGRSLASNRIILAVTTMDAIRRVERKTSPVEVQINTLGDDEVLPLTTRLLPMIVLFALFIAGMFVPAFSLVEEREKKTLSAVLISPASLAEVMTAKATTGFILAVLTALATLLLNAALGTQPAALLISLSVAAVMSVEFGLIYGTVAKDIKTLFTLIKTLNIFLLVPVVFYMFPDWPVWIAKIFPTYWIINPIFEITVKNAGLRSVAAELTIAIVICLILIIPVSALKRRMQMQLALG